MVWDFTGRGEFTWRRKPTCGVKKCLLGRGYQWPRSCRRASPSPSVVTAPSCEPVPCATPTAWSGSSLGSFRHRECRWFPLSLLFLKNNNSTSQRGTFEVAASASPLGQEGLDAETRGYLLSHRRGPGCPGPGEAMRAAWAPVLVGEIANRTDEHGAEALRCTRAWIRGIPRRWHD